MTADEALDTLDRVYHTPLTAPIRQELAALRHDVERHVVIAAGQATEIEKLRALLRESEVWLDIYTPQELRVRIDAALAGEKRNG